MALGEQIKKERTNKKMSVKELSKLSHISISHLYQIERGEKAPSISTTEDIAKALGVPTYILLESTPSYDKFNAKIDTVQLKRELKLSESILFMVKHLGYDPRYIDENTYKDLESKILDYMDLVLFKMYKE